MMNSQQTDRRIRPYIGDHGDPLPQYITSWKNRSKTSELVVWAAVGTTITGFVMQFVGLRGIHSAVSVAQLGVIMAMSAARAALRMQRLKPEDNFLAQCPDEVVGHELDWLAVRIGGEDIQRDLNPSPPPPPGARSTTPDPPRRYFWRFCGTPGDADRIRRELPPTSDGPNAAGKLLAYRTRLAQLTKPPTTQTKAATSAHHFDVGMVEVRENAQRLALAIESAVNTVFSKSPKIRDGWETAESMFWSFACDIASKDLPTNSEQDQASTELRNQHILYLHLGRESPENPWRLQNSLELEGLLGLWVWSLKSDLAVEALDSQSQLTVSRAAEIPARRIVSTNGNIAKTDLKIWLGGEILGLAEDTLHLTTTQPRDPSTIWEQGNGEHNWVKRRSNRPNPTDAHTERAAIALGELYRWALLGNDGTRQFGLDGINWLSGQKSRPSQPLPEAVMKIIDRYNYIATEVGQQEKHLQEVADHLTTTLLDLTLSISMTNEEKGKALCLAAKRGWAEVVLALLELGTEPDFKDADEDSRTALSHAAQSGSIDTLKELMDWGAFPNSADAKHRTPLSYASEIGRSSIVEILLRDRRVDPDAKDGLGRTPLSWAAVKGHKAIIKLLLDSGKVDLDAKDKYGRTPLSLAAMNGHEAIIKLLLDSGKVDLDAKDEDRWMPLSLAAENGHKAVVKLLLDSGKVDPNAKDEDRWMLLSLAAENGHEAVVKLLLDSGKVDPNAKDEDRRRPLSLAAMNGHEAVVKLLLDSGKVEPDAKDEYGRIPLWLAAENRHEAVVKLLLDSSKIDPNAKNGFGQTLLSLAAEKGHEAIVNLLLDSGKVDLDAKDRFGQTPLSLAIEKGHKATVKLLQRRP
ncbi:hypothetical protein N0V84_012520 [Fusarium piperis]|uniref:Ankyrin n=1 Tax=Fusarium piperis TaxID=1435070 RepID=A0A9W8W3I1_9HYPO|nr:hypothetical protein N0V84_012520 [Fusarium piperis]